LTTLLLLVGEGVLVLVMVVAQGVLVDLELEQACR
jgi:hypothetical protein